MGEAYNDEHIAPRLLALAEECSANGLAFVARVEWAPFEGQTTAKRATPGRISASYDPVVMLSKANGNIDNFIFSMARAHNEGKLDLSQTMLAHLLKLGPFVKPLLPESEGKDGR